MDLVESGGLIIVYTTIQAYALRFLAKKVVILCDPGQHVQISARTDTLTFQAVSHCGKGLPAVNAAASTGSHSRQPGTSQS